MSVPARRLRRRLLVLLLLLASSCAKPPPFPFEADRAFFWHAVPPTAGHADLYLLGSIHLSAQPPGPDAALLGAFHAAEILVVEIDPDDVGVLGSMRLLNAFGVYPKGESLAQHVPADVYARLEAWAERRDVGMWRYQRLRPWLVATAVELEEADALGFEAEYGIDMHFVELARDADLEVEPLETPEEQLRAMSGVAPDVQALYLDEVLRSDGALPELFRIWRSGDEEALLALLQDRDPRLEPLLDALIHQRNQRMFERLVERSHDGRRRFVVVGAAHLVGPTGLPALLGRAGWNVRRVAVPAPQPGAAPSTASP